MKALFLILGAFIGVASAQSTQPCSAMSIEAVDKVDPSTPIVFTIRANNNTSLAGLEFRWFLSVGTISSGQGTSSITVDSTGLGGQVITTTVEVIGSQMSCQTSKTVAVNAPAPIGEPVDSYGDIRFEDEKWRLDNFAIAILNWKGSRGQIVGFAGNPTYKGEAAFRLQRAKNYLVNVRGIPPERLVLTDSGYRTDFTVYLWIVPEGAKLVDPGPGVPLSEVRFTKKPPSQPRRTTKPKRT